jgi:predicted aconitase with swiveling domain
MSRQFKARKVVRGEIVAEAIVCPGSFSFLGDVDMGTGEIVAEGNPNRGMLLKDKVLIYKETKGSSGGCIVLVTLARRGVAPAAIVTMKPADYNMAEGAILSKMPFVCSPEVDLLSEIRTGDRVRVNGDTGFVELLSV